MSRRVTGKVRNAADAAKIVFVLSLLLAFGLRRTLAESKDHFPWLGGALFTLIVLSGGFALVSALFFRWRRTPEEEKISTDGQS